MGVTTTPGAGLEGAHLIINSVGCKDCRPIFVAALRDQLKDIAPKLAPLWTKYGIEKEG